MGSASNPTFFSLCLSSHDIRHTKYDIRFMAEREGFLLPRRSRSSAEAGHPHCHSLRSLFFPWKHSGWLRIPRSFLFVSLLTIYDIRNTIYDSWRRGRDSFSLVALAPPPKPATLTVIRSAHSSSPGSIRVGFESQRYYALPLAIHEILTTRYEFVAEREGFEPSKHLYERLIA